MTKVNVVAQAEWDAERKAYKVEDVGSVMDLEFQPCAEGGPCSNPDNPMEGMEESICSCLFQLGADEVRFVDGPYSGGSHKKEDNQQPWNWSIGAI